MEETLNETFENTLDESEIILYNMIQYIISHDIFDTYVLSSDNNHEYKVIIKTHKETSKDLLQHLGKHVVIGKNDNVLTENEQCNICFDTFKQKEHKRVLSKCGHYFHKKCIDKWFIKNKRMMNCPLCRTNYNISYNLF